MNKTYKIEGMHCSACAASVEKILKRQPAVEDASVNLVMEEAVVSFTDGFDEKKAMQAVEKGGFHMKERDAAKQQTYRVEGMHCAACSAAVERVLSRFEEIEQASVNLVMNTVRITFTKKNFGSGSEKGRLHAAGGSEEDISHRCGWNDLFVLQRSAGACAEKSGGNIRCQHQPCHKYGNSGSRPA